MTVCTPPLQLRQPHLCYFNQPLLTVLYSSYPFTLNFRVGIASLLPLIILTAFQNSLVFGFKFTQCSFLEFHSIENTTLFLVNFSVSVLPVLQAHLKSLFHFEICIALLRFLESHQTVIIPSQVRLAHINAVSEV